MVDEVNKHFKATKSAGARPRLTLVNTGKKKRMIATEEIKLLEDR